MEVVPSEFVLRVWLILCHYYLGHSRSEAENVEDVKISNTLVRSVQLGASMWRLEASKDGAGQALDKTVGPRPEPAAAKGEDVRQPVDLKDGDKKAGAWLDVASATSRWNAWKQRLFHNAKSPTVDQWRVIEAISERCICMRREHNSNAQKRSREEPLRLMIQGLPGAGKSQVIQWVRSFFEEVLGWQHGREFVCLASMNTMAALIGGFTIHSWGEVPVNADQQQKKVVLHARVPLMGFMLWRLSSLTSIISLPSSLIKKHLIHLFYAIVDKDRSCASSSSNKSVTQVHVRYRKAR